MAGRRASRDAISRAGWASRIAAAEAGPAAQPAARAALTPRRIVDAALEVVEAEGFADLTMRRVAVALQTGPASLYAHVRNKSDLDDLLIAEIFSRVDLPEPDPERWQQQFVEVCRRVRDELLRYPGIAHAAMVVVPGSLEPLRIGEALLGILLAGGVAPRPAAWTSDAAFLYVTGYCLEAGIARRQGEDADGRVIDRAEILERLRMLPAIRFPNTIRHAEDLTAGEAHDRFDFTLTTLLEGVAGLGGTSTRS